MIVKMLVKLRKIIDRNVNHCNRELKPIKMNQSKADNEIVKIKTNLGLPWCSGH